MPAVAETLQLRWHFPYDIDSGARGLLSGKDSERPAPVLSVHWHPFEQKLLTSGFDGSTKIWTFSTSKNLMESIEHFSTMFLLEKSSCNCARWSPDGASIAAGYNSGEVVIWKPIAEKTPDVTVLSPPDSALNTSSVKSAAQTSWNYEYNVETWNATKVLRSFGESEVYALTFSNDGKMLASGSQEGVFVVHDLERGYLRIRVDNKHVGPIQGITWDPLGKYFLTVGADRKCFVYGVKEAPDKPNLIHVHDTISRSEQGGWLFRGQDATPFYRHASFSPDGLMVALPCGWMSPKSSKNSDGASPGKNPPSPLDPPLHAHPSSSNCAYIFLRHVFQKPYRALCLSNDTPIIGAVFSPRIYSRPTPSNEMVVDDFENTSWGPSEYVMAIAVFSNEIVSIFATSHKSPLVQISEMHLAPITCVSWCQDGIHIAITSDDGTVTMASFDGLLHPLPRDDTTCVTPLRTLYTENQVKLDDLLKSAAEQPVENVPQTTCIPVRRREPKVA